MESVLPPAIAPEPYNSVFLCISLTPPKLLTIHQRPRYMSLVSESVCGPFKGEFWVFRFHLSHPDGQNPHLFLQSDFVGTSLFRTQTLAWEAPVWSFRGATASVLSLLVLNHRVQVWGRPILCLHCSYHSRCGFFLYILRCMCYNQLEFRLFPSCLFYNLFIILMKS